MHYSRMVELIAGVVVILALVGANLVDGPIRRVRPAPMATGGNGGVGQAVMEPTVLIASLGPLRGLAINFLWLRSDQLMQEGKLFEANQLSQLITTLMPHYPEVWSYHAWNMAYNISVMTHTREERWDWVNKGVTLLRDKGIAINPRSAKLYRQLSWVYFHKIGQMADDMHWYYKQQLAQQWHELLGDVPPGAATAQVVDAFRPIAHAPDDLEELRHQVPAVESLITRLRGLQYDLDEVLLRQIGRVLIFRPTILAGGNPSSTQDRQGSPAPDQDTAYDPQLAQLLGAPSVAGAVEPLLAYLRKKVLRDEYRMDPKLMLELMQQYGPIDWRHPGAHAAYWAAVGLGETAKGQAQKDITRLNMNRQVIHAFQLLRRFGRLSYDPKTRAVDMQPDVRFIPAYERAMEKTRKQIRSGQLGDVSMASFESAHENFLLEAITLHYLYGDRDEAGRLHQKARVLYGSKTGNAQSGRYTTPLVELIAGQLRQDLGALSTTNEFVRALLTRAFIEGLARGQMDVYNHYIEIAKQVHLRYQQDQDSQPTAEQDRLKLLSFVEVVTESYIQYMAGVRHEGDLRMRHLIWSNTPITLQQRVYGRLIPVLGQHAQRFDFNLTRAFPPPPGMKPQQRLDPPSSKEKPTLVPVERQ